MYSPAQISIKRIGLLEEDYNVLISLLRHIYKVLSVTRRPIRIKEIIDWLLGITELFVLCFA